MHGELTSRPARLWLGTPRSSIWYRTPARNDRPAGRGFAGSMATRLQVLGTLHRGLACGGIPHSGRDVPPLLSQCGWRCPGMYLLPRTLTQKVLPPTSLDFFLAAALSDPLSLSHAQWGGTLTAEPGPALSRVRRYFLFASIEVLCSSRPLSAHLLLFPSCFVS